MAEAVEFLREKLVQLIGDSALVVLKDLAHDPVDILERSMSSLKEYSSSLKQQRNDKRYQELLLKVRDVVYEIDDFIDDYVAHAEASYFCKAFTTKPVNLRISLDQLLASLQDIIKSYAGDTKLRSDGGGGLSIPDDKPRKSPLEHPPTRHSPVVGFEDKTKEIIGYLREDNEELDVISIVGMPGIGKTALAWKIFYSEDAKYEFPYRVWVNVSEEFSEKEVFLAILKHFRGDISERDDEELAQLVSNTLERKKFLIVMDDVVAAHDLKRLLDPLPKKNYGYSGKVLITSRNEHVVRGWRGNASRPAVRVRLLTQSESWSLLKSEVFGDGRKCPPELESIGKLIADQCDGLPLAICGVADAILRVDLSSPDIGGRRSEWIRVCSQVPKYINNVFYLDLPEHLRICFLYLAMFPPDLEFPVWKLTRLWIAEGFIRRTGEGDDDQNLEETAESYLQDLINRNLVIAGQIKTNGKLKTCRIHRALHEHCRSETERDGFIKNIDFSDGPSYSRNSDLSSKYSRLCIHSKFFDFLHSKPVFPLVRSFIAFSFAEVHSTPEINSTIPAGFKLVRVLDVPIKFTKIPTDMYRLIHLRFLVLSFDSAILPASLSKLRNIQTLILNTKSHTLEIKANMCQFTQLRHLKTNVSTTLTTTGKHTSSNLQTLATVSAESWTDELFARAHDLNKLGIGGKLSLLFRGKIGSFHRLGEMKNLQTLKLRNDISLEGQLYDLPEAHRFPPNLRSLTLANTCLDWRYMRTLALLPVLEVLKLKDNAFIGNNWSTGNGGFDSLEALHIGRTDLVNWVASPNDFPKLKTLKLHNCEQLRELPIQLAYIPNLQCLELFHTKLAAPSAIRIQEDIENPKYEQGTSKISREFKLSIFPSI